jgi:hypothetical protein
MHIKHVSRLAEALIFAHGEHARDEAERMAALFEKTGDARLASDWRKTVAVVSVPKIAEIRNAA